MNLVISLAQFNEFCALNHPILLNLANEVTVRLTIVESIDKVTIQSVLPTPLPIRKDGVFGAYGQKGIFVEDLTIAGLVPNGPAGKVIVFNDGKKSTPVSNVNPHNIPYQFTIGATKNPKATRFDWDLQVAKEVGEYAGFKYKACTKEGHWISVVVAKDKKGKINEIKYTKY